jgi:ubiquinone/menaquinone biosynthesis C-methylase UbiE
MNVAETSEIKMGKNFSEETHWEKAAKTRMGKYLTRIETDFIFKSISLSQTCTILDVGTEAGRFSLLASDNNATVLGIDLDSYSLKRLKRKTKNVNIVQGDANKLPLRDGVLDAILMIEVLDYIAELGDALMECHRTLKPNAALIFSFGNNSSLKSKIREMQGKSYLHAYRRVMRALSKAGFLAVKKIGYSWLPFDRTSESRLIPFLAKLEKIFALRKFPSVSPWVIVYSIKSDLPLAKL